MKREVSVISRIGRPCVVFPGLVSLTSNGDSALLLSYLLFALDASDCCTTSLDGLEEVTGLREERILLALSELKASGFISFEITGTNGNAGVHVKVLFGAIDAALENAAPKLMEQELELFPPPEPSVAANDEASEFSLYCRVSSGRGRGTIIEWHVPKRIVEEYTHAYPGVDVPAQLRRMKAWGLSNPSRVPTVKGVLRFINSWLASQTDRQAVTSSTPARRNFRSAPEIPANKPQKHVFLEE